MDSRASKRRPSQKDEVLDLPCPQQLLGVGEKDHLDNERFKGEPTPKATSSGSTQAYAPSLRKRPLRASSEGDQRLQRLHPRNLVPHQPVEAVQGPIHTAISSVVEVILSNGVSTIGNILVPAASRVINIDGYAPVTLNRPPPVPTSPPANPPPPPSPHTIKPQHPSNSPRPFVPRPPKATQQPAAASPQNTINPQNSMSNEAVESRSQTIRSSPSTHLPLNSPGSPSLSTTSSSSPLQTINSATASPTVGSNQTPQQASDGILTISKGNFSTSAFTLPSTAPTLSGSVPFIFNSSTTASIAFPSTSSTGAIPTSEPLVNSSEATALSSTLATSPRSHAASSSIEPFTISSLQSASSTSLVTSTGGGDDVRPTITGTGQSSASNTAAAGAGSSGDNGPPTSTVVGGVVGGVCGVALLIFLLLLFLRLRRKGALRRTISPPIPQTSAPSGATAEGGTMTERSSAAIPLAAAGFWRSLRPRSGQTATTTETAPSERGFQNLGGRKLDSVLSTRGDGYGDLPFGAAGTSGGPGPTPTRGQAPPAIPIVTAAPGAVPGHSSPESLSGSSFYRDSHGFYGGPQAGQDNIEPSSNSTSMYVGPGSRPTSLGVSQDTGPPEMGEGVAVMRPGPARTPVTSQGGFSPMRGSSRTPRGTAAPHVPGTVPEDLPQPRDGVGRSHPSLDGSRGSRFHEDV